MILHFDQYKKYMFLIFFKIFHDYVLAVEIFM